MLRVTAIDHVVLNVRDVAVSADWYVKVLGVTREEHQPASGAVRTSIRFGDQKINLRPADASQEAWFTGRAPVPGSDDLCFLTDTTPERVVAHLEDCGVAIALGPVVKRGARGEIRSVYCRDPDGNLIEIASYP